MTPVLGLHGALVCVRTWGDYISSGGDEFPTKAPDIGKSLRRSWLNDRKQLVGALPCSECDSGPVLHLDFIYHVRRNNEIERLRREFASHASLPPLSIANGATSRFTT